MLPGTTLSAGSRGPDLCVAGTSVRPPYPPGSVETLTTRELRGGGGGAVRLDQPLTWPTGAPVGVSWKTFRFSFQRKFAFAVTACSVILKRSVGLKTMPVGSLASTSMGTLLTLAVVLLAPA